MPKKSSVDNSQSKVASTSVSTDDNKSENSSEEFFNKFSVSFVDIRDWFTAARAVNDKSIQPPAPLPWTI